VGRDWFVYPEQIQFLADSSFGRMQFEIMAKELDGVGYFAPECVAASPSLKALVMHLPNGPAKRGSGTFVGEDAHGLS
jgi:hypothetical protein